MHKLIICTLFINSLGFKSQNTRFIYDHRSVKDSTKTEVIDEETYYLDTFTEGSGFYSYDNFKQDSLAKSYGDSWFNVSDRVFKTYPKYNVTLISKVEQDLFEVKDDRQIIWKISLKLCKLAHGNLKKRQGILRDDNGLHGFQPKFQFKTALINYMVCQV